jgi:hypothetical protein
MSILDATMSPFSDIEISFVERTSFPSQTTNMIRLSSLQSSPAPALHQSWLAKPIVWGRRSLNQASATQFRMVGEYYEDLDKVTNPALLHVNKWHRVEPGPQLVFRVWARAGRLAISSIDIRTCGSLHL